MPPAYWIIAWSRVSGLTSGLGYRQGTLYFDGALGDPVPVQKAFDLGCDRVVLTLTKPESEIRHSGKDKKIAALIRSLYEKGIHDAQRIARFMQN